MPSDYTIDGYAAPAHVTIDQIQPRADILLVRRIPDAEITASGLVVPQIARDAKTGVRVGEVLRIGPGDGPPMECQVGDKIAYRRVPDNDVNIGGVDCVFLREEQHVLAIL